MPGETQRSRGPAALGAWGKPVPRSQHPCQKQYSIPSALEHGGTQIMLSPQKSEDVDLRNLSNHLLSIKHREVIMCVLLYYLHY